MALLHPVMLESTVVVETENGMGTGFIILRKRQMLDSREEEKWMRKHRGIPPGWRLWFVTCAHVVEKEKGGIVRITRNARNPDEGKTELLYPKDLWHTAKGWNGERYEYDVAVAPAPIKHKEWERAEIGCIPSSMHLNRQKMADNGIENGDEVYVLGHPLGIGNQERNWPVVRQGIIAECKQYKSEEGGAILVDGAIWGGASGGPVITKPEMFALEGTKQTVQSWLLGMVQGTVAEEMRGIEIPAGIGIVIPMETINRVIEEGWDEGGYR